MVLTNELYALCMALNFFLLLQLLSCDIKRVLFHHADILFAISSQL